MANSHKITDLEAKKQHPQETVGPELNGPFSPDERDYLLYGPEGVLGRGSNEYQIARLSDPQLDENIRQFLAQNIGEAQGNLHLASIIQRLQNKPGNISLPPSPEEKPFDPSTFSGFASSWQLPSEPADEAVEEKPDLE